MALSNKFNQLSLYGGGSTPTWKRLGYSSQAEYINALTGADGKKKIPTTLEEAYGASSAIHLSPQDRLGNFDQDVVAKVWNGSGSGGVTDEGVVIGNPNVEKFPTIKNSSSGQKSSDTLAGMKETNVVASGGGSVPAGNDGTSAGTGGAATATGSNEFGAKYQGNDFLEWYKANYGADYDPSQGFSRGQGMSDVDWAIGSNLYNSYLTGQNLENSYNSSKSEVENNYAAQSEALKNIYEQSVSRLDELYQAEIEKLQQNYGMSVDSLDTSKRNSQQAASITLDKLKKYLPTQIKAQGLGGLGVSESSMLQAYNEYNNRMGEIEGGYNANRASLDASYNDSKSALDTTRSSGVSDASLEYQKNQSALDTNRNSALSELERAYLENKTNLGVAAGEQSQNIFDKYLADYKAEQDELYAEAADTILNSGYTTEEEMQAYIDQFRGKLSSENIASLQQYANGIAATNAENEQKELYDSALSAVMNSGYTTEQEILSFIDQFKGKLSEENISTLKQYAKGLASQNLKEQQDYNFALAEQAYLDGSYNSAAELEEYFNKFKGKVSESQWNTMQSYLSVVKNSYEEQMRQEAIKEQQELEEFNSITRGDVAFNNNGGWWIFGATDYRDGDNFSVKDGDGFIYRIQSGGEVADSNIANAARDVSNREVFGYGGKLYYKENGKIYLVEKRDNSYGDHYDKLYKRFFG